MDTRKKYAFISYSHRDEKQARWLQSKLESYRLPAEIHNEYEDSRYLRPIFRDRADLGAGVLNNELRRHLESSKYLIVVCSPQAAASKWVNDEIATFLEWGRGDYIVPFIVMGDINSEGEDNPLPHTLREYYATHPDKELLSVDIREAGRTKAYIRVVSYMLGIEFDELWQRHLRARRRKIALSTAITLLLTFALYWFATPISLNIRLRDAEHSLPMPDDAIVVIDGVEYRPSSLNDCITIDDLPGYYRLRDIDVEFKATYYNTTSTRVKLGVSSSNEATMVLQRDDSFGVFAGKVVDSDFNPIEGVLLNIDGTCTTTNSNGEFRMEFKVCDQTTQKSVTLTKSGYADNRREDESPSENIIYVMHTQIDEN